MLDYRNERPDGGKIVDGVIFGNHCPFVILYTMQEGAMFEVLGCASEELADNILKRFEEQGDMDNPRAWAMGREAHAIRPYTMVKAKVDSSKVWVPDR